MITLLRLIVSLVELPPTVPSQVQKKAKYSDKISEYKRQHDNNANEYQFVTTDEICPEPSTSRCLSTENVNKIISINETQDIISNIKGTFFIGYLF